MEGYIVLPMIFKSSWIVCQNLKKSWFLKKMPRIKVIFEYYGPAMAHIKIMLGVAHLARKSSCGRRLAQLLVLLLVATATSLLLVPADLMWGRELTKFAAGAVAAVEPGVLHAVLLHRPPGKAVGGWHQVASFPFPPSNK